MPSSPRRAWCAALVAGLVLAACSSGGAGKSASTTTTAPNARVRVTPGTVTVASAGPAVQLAIRGVQQPGQERHEATPGERQRR